MIPVQDKVIGEILTERARQDEKWGGAVMDDVRKTPEDWCKDIEAYVVWARQMSHSGSPSKYRRRMMQVAALAVAAFESFDRKLEGPAMSQPLRRGHIPPRPIPSPKPLLARPNPPASKLICDRCGDITRSGHTSWLCRFFTWLDRGRSRDWGWRLAVSFAWCAATFWIAYVLSMMMDYWKPLFFFWAGLAYCLVVQKLWPTPSSDHPADQFPDHLVINERDIFLLHYKMPMGQETIERIAKYYLDRGIRVAVLDCDELYVLRRDEVREAGKEGAA